MHSNDANADFAEQVMPTSKTKQIQNQLSTALSMSAGGGLEGENRKPISDDQKQAAISKFNQYFEKKGVDHGDC